MFIKKVGKNGQVSIPKQIQRQLHIQDGDYLFIYKQEDSIVIENHHKNNQLNQCVFRNGRISVPIELRRILNIKQGAPLIMEASGSENKILLKQNYPFLPSREA